jgi:hypothetical protein
MSILTDVGNLMYLYLDELQVEQSTTVPEFMIQATAKLLESSGGRNWVPVIVREIGKDRYEVIANAFVYAVAEAAGLERLWCIVADSSDMTADLSRALAQESIPKINLSIATRDEIMAALRYLIEQPNSALKGVDLSVAVNRIETARDRPYWKSLDAIAALKCKITKGTKLDALQQVFYLTPEPTPPPGKVDDLHKMSASELKAMAKSRQIPGYSKLKKADLIMALSGE